VVLSHLRLHEGFTVDHGGAVDVVTYVQVGPLSGSRNGTTGPTRTSQIEDKALLRGRRSGADTQVRRRGSVSLSRRTSVAMKTSTSALALNTPSLETLRTMALRSIVLRQCAYRDPERRTSGSSAAITQPSGTKRQHRSMKTAALVTEPEPQAQSSAASVA
jgi:hypothetical protein